MYKTILSASLAAFLFSGCRGEHPADSIHTLASELSVSPSIQALMPGDRLFVDSFFYGCYSSAQHYFEFRLVDAKTVRVFMGTEDGWNSFGDLPLTDIRLRNLDLTIDSYRGTSQHNQTTNSTSLDLNWILNGKRVIESLSDKYSSPLAAGATLTRFGELAASLVPMDEDK